jgi:hypothetical protein
VGPPAAVDVGTPADVLAESLPQAGHVLDRTGIARDARRALTRVVVGADGTSASAGPGGTHKISEVPEEVVWSAMSGHRAAVARLLATIRPLVVRYCRARLGSADRAVLSADDVAQEVCLAVLTALPSYRAQGRPFLAFVYRIAGNKLVDAHRTYCGVRLLDSASSHPGRLAQCPDA